VFAERDVNLLDSRISHRFLDVEELLYTVTTCDSSSTGLNSSLSGLATHNAFNSLRHHQRIARNAHSKPPETHYLIG
jgi:hypothetical protein